MTIFNFYRAGKRWVVKINACQDDGSEVPVAVFPPETTDDEITQIAITLAKADTISTNIDFKEG